VKVTVEKRPYEKPIVKREGEMRFMRDIIASARNDLACRQCSSCHGCR